MKKAVKIIISWSIFTLSIFGCSTPDEIPAGEFATGVVIINEGNFSESNGSVSFYNESKDEVEQDIYAIANGVSTGGIIQSVYFYNDLAFIIDQVGNRIEVVEAETFEAVATIDAGLSTPRYMTVVDGKAYVSNWGEFDADYDLPDSYLAVIDLNAYAVTSTIKVGNGAEGLLEFGGYVYVANSYTNTIEQIDLKTDIVSGAIEVATGPQGFVEDKNGKVWVLSSSFFAGSALTQVDLAMNDVLKSFEISEAAKSLTINGAGDQLYYLSTPYGSDAQVKSLPIEANVDARTAVIIGPNLYGLGIDPASNIIYIGNHNGFQGNGTVLRYNRSELIDSFSAGIAPNGFVFRK